MPPKTAYQKTLDELAALLRKRPRTAREIADVMQCCRPAAYQRIAALRRRKGCQVYEASDRAAGQKTGPRATAYGVR